MLRDYILDMFVISVTNEKPVQVTLYQVKKSDKVDSYKKKLSWPLRQIRLFDAKFSDKVYSLIKNVMNVKMVY